MPAGLLSTTRLWLGAMYAKLVNKNATMAGLEPEEN
jgi:hypothetical protein